MLFISHRSVDKQFALEVKRRALERGYSDGQIFLDSDPDAGIAAGASWRKVIYDRLKNCQALIVIYSSRWRESIWCAAELGAAETLGKLVIPVAIEDCAVDSILNERQLVSVFRESDAAYDRLWKALEQNGLGPHDHRPWPPPDERGRPTDPCPYPGLMAFSERFAPVYFGRDRETREVHEMLNRMRDRGEPRLLMIDGGSGSGKSSLMRAGVLPRLDRGLGFPRGERDADSRNGDAGHDIWHVLPTLRYGQTPNDDLTLPAILAQELAARFPANAPERPDWKALRAKFAADDVEQAARDFFETTQDLNLALGCRHATTLLPIDQFEELLADDAQPAAAHFLRFLHALLTKNNGRLLVIGTLRSDYLDVYERHPHALQPPYLANYRLPPFPWERVMDVIVQPAARVGATFSTELLERLKLDAPNSDALPLLAFTLEKLFRQCAADLRIELDEYEALGGMTGAIEQAATRIAPPRLPANTEQALRLSFVRHLVQVNERGEFVRRPALWSDLPAAARPLLDKFVQERLLQISGEGDATSVEVTHEALFRCWPALVGWLKVSARVLRWRRDVERDRQASGDSWHGLTRAQLAVSRRWPTELPDELSRDEIGWITRAVRRERIVQSAVAAVIAVISGLGGLAWYLRSESAALALSRNEQLVEANHNLGLALLERANKYEEERQYAHAYATAGRAVGFEGRTGATTSTNFPCLLKRDSEAFLRASTLARHSASLSQWPSRIIFRTKNPLIWGIAVDATGKRLAVENKPGEMCILDLESGRTLRELRGFKGDVTDVQFSKSGMVATGHTDGAIFLWDLSSGAGRKIKSESGQIMRLAFSPDDKSLAVAGQNEEDIGLWDLRTLARQPLNEPGDAVRSVAFQPNSEHLLLGTENGYVRIYDLRAGRVVAKFRAHEDYIWSLAFHPDGTRFASGGRDRQVKLWRLADALANDAPEPVGAVAVHQDQVSHVAFSENGRALASSSWHGDVLLSDAATMQPLATLDAHNGRTDGLAFLPGDSIRLVTGDIKGVVREWNISDDSLRPAYLIAHSRPVGALAVHPTKDLIASGGWDGKVILWERATGKSDVLDESPAHITALGFSPNGERLFAGRNDGRISAIQIAERKVAFVTDDAQAKDWVQDVETSPDGKLFASSDNSGKVRLWDASTGALAATIPAHIERAMSASFTQNGTRLVTSGGDGCICGWDLTDGNRQLWKRQVHKEKTMVGSIIAPDGRHVVSVGWDGKICITELDSGKLVASLDTGVELFKPLALTKDMQRLAVTCFDRTVRIWDLRTKRVVAIMPDKNLYLYSLALTNDDRWLVYPGDGGTIKFLDMRLPDYPKPGERQFHFSGLDTVFGWP